YQGNYASTTKYTLLSYLPKALFEQYRRVANIFFTLMAALSLTPWSPVRPWTTWTPLVLVVGVSLAKEAREDFKRYQQDQAVNSRPASIMSRDTGDFVTVPWRDVRVGDLLRVARDEPLPADMVLLDSSNPEGCCHVETVNLDGETNLKIKAAPEPTRGLAAAGELRALLATVLECEPPNSRLYAFTGNLHMPLPLPAMVIPLSASALLLRGCSIRNTDCVYGVVVYAGHDTKIFMNSTEPPSKRSSLECSVDRVIVVVFVLLFGWCLTSAVFHARWTSTHLRRHWYMLPEATTAADDPDRTARTGAVNFFVALLLYSYLVPISLYVSIEMVKVFQAGVLMSCDRDMYHSESDTPATARTSNLNEELGQVAAVMTDKTGTLTRNVMEFFKCSIAGVAYGVGVTEIERTNLARQGTVPEERSDPRAAQYRERYFNFYDERLMGDAWTRGPDADSVEMFFRLLAVCHTVVSEGQPDPRTIKYEAESPDEAALVVAAKAFGFFFLRRTQSSVFVRERGRYGGQERDVEYEVLNVLEFTSTRKRMSVVIRDKTRNTILVFTKGADTVIYERLDPKYGPNEAMKESTGRHMEEFGAAGLRTLCLSYAEVDREWYGNVWLPEYLAAKTSLVDRDEKVAEVSEKIERNLRLLGCTAIEDKLQEGVPQCIKQLAMAGIRIWVLTGDKMETAINIGFACSLLREDMMQVYMMCDGTGGYGRVNFNPGHHCEKAKVYMLTSRFKLETSRLLNGCSIQLSYASSSVPKICKMGLMYHPKLRPTCPVMKVHCSRHRDPHPLNNPPHALPTFLLLVLRAVRTITPICLLTFLHTYIHTGVGISGQEGMQAVMSSDFAIAQFRFLVPLLLVHGQYSYRRLSRMINFFFYKNLLFALTLFTYSAFTAFSGSYVYNDTSMTLFNVMFTSAAPLLIGMFDRHLPKDVLLRYPQLYRSGVANEAFSPRRVGAWLGAAAAQAGVLMSMVMVGASGTAASGPGGVPFGMAQIGAVLFTAVLLTVHLQLAVLEEEWTVLHHAAIWGSL
ncbi:hypothetical protein VOLCADRAFT_40206, partial [Volvox carteri f. nagariensis]